MRRFILLSTLIIGGLTIGFAQQSIKGSFTEKVKLENGEKDLQVNYALKSKEENTQLMKIRFFNKTKANLNVDLVMGIYSNGVLLEKAEIADCLKKSFFNNFFRPYHLVETNISSNKDIDIKILNILTEPVDECRQTHK